MKTHNVQLKSLMSHLKFFYRRIQQIKKFYLIYHLTYRILSPNIVKYQEIYTKKSSHISQYFQKYSASTRFSCDQNKQAKVDINIDNMIRKLIENLVARCLRKWIITVRIHFGAQRNKTYPIILISSYSNKQAQFVRISHSKKTTFWEFKTSFFVDFVFRIFF